MFNRTYHVVAEAYNTDGDSLQAPYLRAWRTRTYTSFFAPDAITVLRDLLEDIAQANDVKYKDLHVATFHRV
jgi:hypothetical protein